MVGRFVEHRFSSLECHLWIGTSKSFDYDSPKANASTNCISRRVTFDFEFSEPKRLTAPEAAALTRRLSITNALPSSLALA